MDEYIKREAAVTVCDEQYKECLRKSDFCGDAVAWNICADIKAIPAADVAPVVHSYWEHKITSCEENISICHNCKYPVSWFWGLSKYCPNCGAKMEGDG